MRLLRSRNPKSSSDGVSQIEFNNNPDRRWPMLFAALAVALVIALGLFYGGRWAYRSIFGDDEPTVPVVQAPKKDTTTTQPGATPQPPSPQTGGTPTASPNTGPSATEIPNSGPGEVVSLFIASSIAAAGLHYIFTLRRQTS